MGNFYHLFVFNEIRDYVTQVNSIFEDFQYKVDKEEVEKYLKNGKIIDDKTNVVIEIYLVYEGNGFYVFNWRDYDEDLYFVYIHNQLKKDKVLKEIMKSKINKQGLIKLLSKYYKFFDEDLLELMV